jgi:hypothetical protein
MTVSVLVSSTTRAMHQRCASNPHPLVMSRIALRRASRFVVLFDKKGATLSFGENHHHLDTGRFGGRSCVLETQRFDVDPMLSKVIRHHSLGTTPDPWIDEETVPGRKYMSHETNSSLLGLREDL